MLQQLRDAHELGGQRTKGPVHYSGENAGVSCRNCGYSLLYHGTRPAEERKMKKGQIVGCHPHTSQTKMENAQR